MLGCSQLAKLTNPPLVQQNAETRVQNSKDKPEGKPPCLNLSFELSGDQQ